MDGWIALYRKILDSQVFQNEGLLKVWIWCLCKARYKEAWIPIKIGKNTKVVKILPGQFIFGRKSAAEDLKMKPSTVRNRMKKLSEIQNIQINSYKNYSIIVVLNWHFYQNALKEDNQTLPELFDNSEMQETNMEKKTPKGHPNPQKRTPKGQKEDTRALPETLDNSGYQESDTKKRTSKDQKEDTQTLKKGHKQELKKERIKDPDFFLTEIESLRNRYPDRGLIDRTLDTIRTTRKSNRISDSVIYDLFHKLSKYPVQQVQAGCRIYLEKQYYLQGKDEKYLMGIIRKQSDTPDQTEEQEARPSSGSSLLDAYYSGKLNIKSVKV